MTTRFTHASTGYSFAAIIHLGTPALGQTHIPLCVDKNCKYNGPLPQPAFDVAANTVTVPEGTLHQLNGTTWGWMPGHSPA